MVPVFRLERNSSGLQPDAIYQTSSTGLLLIPRTFLVLILIILCFFGLLTPTFNLFLTEFHVYSFQKNCSLGGGVLLQNPDYTKHRVIHGVVSPLRGTCPLRSFDSDTLFGLANLNLDELISLSTKGEQDTPSLIKNLFGRHLFVSTTMSEQCLEIVEQGVSPYSLIVSNPL